MEKRTLGNSKIAVTPVGMGCRTIGPSRVGSSLASGARLISYALEQGVNFLDTAENYRTYGYVRRALEELAPAFAQNALPRPVIAGKSLAPDYEGMRRAIEDCRAALDLDQIDIFLLQEVAQLPDFENRSGAWVCLQDAKAKGYIKAAGISTHYADTVLEAAETPGMDVLFPLINYMGLGIRSGSGTGTKEEMAGAIRAAAERGVGICAMGVLGGGDLARDYIQALDYATGLAGVQSVLIGFGYKEDVDAAALYFEGRLPKDYAPGVPQKRMFVDPSKCTGCGACVNYCTSKAFSPGADGIAEVNHENCVRCGFCLYVCPMNALLFL